MRKMTFHLLAFLLGTSVIMLVACAAAPSKEVGQLNEVKNTVLTDVARSLSIEVWKFEYTLKPGKYDSDVWLEELDAGTTTPQRLTPGKSSFGSVTDGGNLIVSVGDPARTQNIQQGNTRVVFSQELMRDNISIGSASGINFVEASLGINGQTKVSADNVSIELRKEMTLIEWTDGELVKGDNGNYMNARTVYLKMKVMPYGEVFGD